MTRWFYNTFFNGNTKNEYGHFSFSVILSFIVEIVVAFIYFNIYDFGVDIWIASAITVWTLMFLIELTPYNRFSWCDIRWNTYGVAFYCLIKISIITIFL